MPCSGVNQAMHANVVSKPTNWPDADPQHSTLIRRGGLSAFGFGGTNAHAVFEKYAKGRYPVLPQAVKQPKKSSMLSIVGMDCVFGEAKSLEAFEQRVYSFRSVKRTIPDNRWRFLTKDPVFHEALFSE